MMHTISSRSVLLFLVLSLLSMTGCGGAKIEVDPEKNATGFSGREALLDLKEMLDTIASQKKPFPKGPADLAAWGPVFPAAEMNLNTKQIVYVWGSKIDSANPNDIIGYEKDAPEKGGFVLMQDGNVKKLTVDEFKAAKIAGK